VYIGEFAQCRVIYTYIYINYVLRCDTTPWLQVTSAKNIYNINSSV